MRTSDNTDPGKVKSPFELIKPGNKPGDNGNYRLTFSGADVLEQLKVSGTWTTVRTIKGS
jgi:hypothetical protein